MTSTLTAADTTTNTVATDGGTKKLLLVRMARQAGLAVVIVLLVLGFGIAKPLFLDSGNLINVLLQASVVGILAVGETFVLITGGIDLSIGSTIALSGVSAGLLTAHVPPGVAILGGIGVGLLAGLLNGLLITLTGITPFIITLGTMSIFSGLALIISGGKAVYSIPAGFQNLLASKIAGLPIPIYILVLLSIVSALVLRYTRLGEYLVAVGGNTEVARLAGIDVRRITLHAYLISGACAGLAATILVARLGAADPTMGADLLLTAIAATVMGGTRLSGGHGSVVGAAMGAILLAALTAGLTTLNVASFYQQVAVGAAIILALLVDTIARRRH